MKSFKIKFNNIDVVIDKDNMLLTIQTTSKILFKYHLNDIKCKNCYSSIIKDLKYELKQFAYITTKEKTKIIELTINEFFEERLYYFNLN